jgi:hypothetical protein
MWTLRSATLSTICVTSATTTRPSIVDDTQIVKGVQNLDMKYSVGSRVQVKLYSGKVVEAEITAITNQSTGHGGERRLSSRLEFV